MIPEKFLQTQVAAKREVKYQLNNKNLEVRGRNSKP